MSAQKIGKNAQNMTLFNIPTDDAKKHKSVVTTIWKLPYKDQEQNHIHVCTCIC